MPKNTSATNNDSFFGKAKTAFKKGTDYVNANLNPLTAKPVRDAAKKAITGKRDTARMNGAPFGGNLRKREMDKAIKKSGG